MSVGRVAGGATTAPVAGRLRGRPVFRALARSRRRAARGPLTVTYVPWEAVTTTQGRQYPARQVGYAIGRRYGSAVWRNRIRRRLRAAVREVGATVPVGAYLVRADRAAEASSYPELVRSVERAMTAAAGSNRSPKSTGSTVVTTYEVPAAQREGTDR